MRGSKLCASQTSWSHMQKTQGSRCAACYVLIFTSLRDMKYVQVYENYVMGNALTNWQLGFAMYQTLSLE